MKSRKKKTFVHYLAMLGCISTGIIYAAIGVIAILSFLKLKNGGADEGSLLVFLDRFLVGRLVIGIILLGMISYIFWRMYETIKDPYGYGTDLKGILRRAVTALSGLADALIASSAIQALLGTGGIAENGLPTAQQEIAGKMLLEEWGVWTIVIIAFITAVTAIAQFGYVISKNYMERLDIVDLPRWTKAIIHFLAWSGHFARGIILGIISFFFFKTAVSENERFVVNTDKAFDFIGDNIGHAYFIIVAIGTVFYGFFMFAFGVYYDSGKDL